MVISAAAALTTLFIGHASVYGQRDLAALVPYNWCNGPEIASALNISALCDRHNTTVWNQRVNLTMFYQFGCGGCAYLITQIWPRLRPAYKATVNFEFVPFGLADTAECEQSDNECWLTHVQTCAIHYITDEDKLFDFIVCIESQDDDATPEQVLPGCFKNTSIAHRDQKSISECYNSEFGTQLEEVMKNRSQSVWPLKNHWIPWLVINGASTMENQAAILDLDDDDKMINQLTLMLDLAYQGDNHWKTSDSGRIKRKHRAPPKSKGVARVGKVRKAMP